ncbi:hypothetical protein [Singulisphaera sp. PoT]|uniref:hypothetical protein n=1 Tax=Singulisphaera sp. PoT TaxID=3411797 RepID=UPI003BF548C4
MDQISSSPSSTGEKAEARDILAAVRTLKSIERENRPADEDDRVKLGRFGGFGAVALSIFPDPVTGKYKDPGWEYLGDELKSLLTPEEYDSAKRTTFSQFFTPPIVMAAMHEALSRLGVADDAVILEPGCGVGNFLSHGEPGRRFIGVELDSISGRIARVLHPRADIRIENFRDSRLPPLDAVIGNVPFADIKLEYEGDKLSLHDYFIVKSVDSLRPGGVLAVVTSRYTLDKQDAAVRERLAARADFLGAIRLPSDAFKREGTQVTTDILFLRKRTPGQEPNHADPEWLETSVLGIQGADLPVNRYFCNHHEMVLGDWSRQDTLYGSGFSVKSNGGLASQLKDAVGRIAAPGVKESLTTQSEAERPNPPPIPAHKHGSPPAFQPPPPLRHITEGSLFVGDDKVIRQVEDGNAQPVTYCGVLLKADGTPLARKIGSLIQLRDLARRVLQSQNEDWPEANREDARRDLNRAYDLFVFQHGPINKTTFTETKTGTIRRMPNLVKFKEDPDAMLVMALEEYDEATGMAGKAPILLRDVVGPKPPITRVTSAEEGLLVSLNDRGVIDLSYIAELYGKPEAAIVAELGDLIYRDPESLEWQTADEYLSGNVRAKWVAAEKAGPEYARNAEALRLVQPEDVLPGDIDANLGAPWIPEQDIRAFAADLFNVPVDSFKVGHLKKDAVWSVEPDYRAINSVAATADYGTSRINGTELLSQALNLKSPVIYDIVRGPNGDERVLNPIETASAKEKQKLIKEKFKGWIFSDPDRTERLVRDYNDTYNNLRPRLFDGSHLDFPGMSKAITLKPHQVDAVWRCMTVGNTLLAHCVGAGKSFEMAAGAMKMKQAGLIKKPLIAIPNHMLEQFSREFMQLYPNAKLLVASKEDFSKDRRKMMTAKIATGDWDAIIVTHSSFERIGISRGYRERFLREQIEEYESLLVDKASQGRNIIKTLEKQKANREERLKRLLAEDKKDDGLVFDELGVDQIFYDESQAGKNLETPTKMDRVAGIQTGGSERAFDLYMKARYLGQGHPGHGVVFASGTPISNSMVEMYTQCRYLDPEGLRSRGIDHFDAWAATFGEVVEAMEISPDGASLRPRSRFAKFVNLPELVQMFRSFADVQTADMLDLPRPKLEGGKPITVACPMSEEQADLQTALVKRYERLRNEKVDPREDNALAITTDGRKLALDGRMLRPGPDFAESKINALARNVRRIWGRTADTRGTQMIFGDMGVNPTAWGFSAYDEVIGKLVEAGIPRQQIADIGDADTDAKKQALFEKVRQGTVRVLIGSTQKMGTGTNVQKRLVALHHLDAPWKPAEVEQRDGRILRQGNDNPEVAIYRYVTTGSFDSFMWQALETKARFIAQVMSGDCAVRKAEDVGDQELSYAEVKSIASGNPAVLTLAESDAELQRLAILRKNHHDEQYLARRNLRDLPDSIRHLTKRVEGLMADMATIAGNPGTLTVEGIAERMKRMPEKVSETYRTRLGTYRGLEAGIILHPPGGTEVYLDGSVRCREQLLRDNPGPRAVLNALERLADGYGWEMRHLRADIALKEGQLRDYESRLGTKFAHEEYASQLADLRDELRHGLSEKPPEGCGPVAEVAEKIKALRESVTVEATPERAVRKAVRAEKPVTARIRERLGKLRPVEVAEEAAPIAAVESPVEAKPEPIPEQDALVLKMPAPARPVSGHAKAVTKRRREDETQLRLF